MAAEFFKNIHTKVSILCIYTVCMYCIVGCTGKQSENNSFSEDIRINQLGYFPNGPKVFVVVNTDATAFNITNKHGEIVYSGDLFTRGQWDASGEDVKTGDFSTLNIPGEYSIEISDKGKSFGFRVDNGIYQEPAVASLRAFYYQRASMEMDEKYLGEYSRKMGHPDDTCYFHPSTGKNGGFISSPGGWYDAGDYGKYVVNAAVSVGTLLALYEAVPGVFPDNSLHIPESGNNLCDILDEVKYELDWLFTMQDDDGGVFHKLTSLEHDSYVMPEQSTSKRYIISKSTAATLGFAAIMAQASRIYRPFDPSFADKCLNVSIDAWGWAQRNPKQYFTENPKGVNTGMYKDSILQEEFFWAAAELFATTHDPQYFREIDDLTGSIRFRIGESWRNYVDNLGYYSLLSSGVLNQQNESILTQRLIHLADSLKERMIAIPYRIPIEEFHWGSNSDFLNVAILFTYAHSQTNDPKYIDATIEAVDYVMGKNATGYCFVSGFGSKRVMDFHHRLFVADSNVDPFPGFVTGGPNQGLHDAGWMESQGVFYQDTLPAKAFIDNKESYASNEICINWNAPLVFMLAYLNNYFNQ